MPSSRTALVAVATRTPEPSRELVAAHGNQRLMVAGPAAKKQSVILDSFGNTVFIGLDSAQTVADCVLAACAANHFLASQKK